MMAMLELTVRRRRMMNASDPNVESNFHTDDVAIELDPDETGFVLVDMWDASGLPDEIKPGGRSFCERAGRITRKAIAPALHAAREAGLTVIHAPTANVSEHYRDTCRVPDAPPAETGPDRDWPPAEARQAWSQEMWEARYGDYGPDLRKVMNDEMRILPEAAPIESDWLIFSSEDMHAICRERGLLNLVYVGFATNICLLFKPGALWEMSRAGYRCVVLSDCTTAVENADSIADLEQTNAFLDWFEMMALAYTARSADFVEACGG
ncbi:MAG: isochorismatase family protein [Armatimonadia bacterium]|nr:isochorismatase family protein [Armatimonadia bacterium]